MKKINKKNNKTLREKVIDEIKEYIIPEIRKREFKGSYPHFKRIKNNQIDLLSFQFDKYGSAFWIEISVVYTENDQYTNIIFPKEESIEKINVYNTNIRYRLLNEDGDFFNYQDNNITKCLEQAKERLYLIDEWYNNPRITKKKSIITLFKSFSKKINN